MGCPRSGRARKSSVESPLTVGAVSRSSLVRGSVGSRTDCWRRADCRLEFDLDSYSCSLSRWPTLDAESEPSPPAYSLGNSNCTKSPGCDEDPLWLWLACMTEYWGEISAGETWTPFSWSSSSWEPGEGEREWTWVMSMWVRLWRLVDLATQASALTEKLWWTTHPMSRRVRSRNYRVQPAPGKGRLNEIALRYC